jgi:hypothetical protein
MELKEFHSTKIRVARVLASKAKPRGLTELWMNLRLMKLSTSWPAWWQTRLLRLKRELNVAADERTKTLNDILRSDGY